MTLNAESNADGTVDAAFVGGGAVVFGALVEASLRQVRFRAVDDMGAPLGDERALTVFPSVGTDASIAAFAGGYVVTYRRLPGEGMPAQIRLLLVTELGDVVSETTVADAAVSGGRTTVRVSGEGRMAVSWADVIEGATVVRLALLRCVGTP
jgi:hypothetical protein